MAFKYRLPNGTYLLENEQFYIGDGDERITYPPNWLQLASAQDLAEHRITKEEIIPEPVIILPKTEKDIIDAHEFKIAEAFAYMESRLELEVVDQAILSANSEYLPFGCDKVTQDNIIGITVAIAVGIPVPNPTYWTPKGYPFPILITHQEIIGIGGSILNKKNELYGIYFNHKASIMMTSNYDAIIAYDSTTGYGGFE